MIPFDAKNWFWIVAGDEQRAYSSAAQAYVPVADADPDRTRKISSEADMIGVLRAANVPPYHRVSVYRIIRRLEASGFATQALAVIDAPQNAVLKARFYGLAGLVELGMGVPADDPDAVALVRAAGADPAVILAPETSGEDS
jgi:hypothetical protein